MTLPLANALGAWLGWQPQQFDVVASPDGEGTLNSWDPRKFEMPRPSDAQMAAVLKRYYLDQFSELAQQYLVGVIFANEFGDNTRLQTVKTKLAAWKAAHPGIIQ